MLKCESRALDLRLEVHWNHAVQLLTFTMVLFYTLLHLTVMLILILEKKLIARAGRERKREKCGVNVSLVSVVPQQHVVKVAGSNISHKLRLSSVKPSDEGTYECRVIDFSDSKLRHHRVRAYLQVERPEGNAAPPVHQGATSQEEVLQSDHHKHQPAHHAHHKPGRELRKRSTDDSTTDCTESCAL
ncbi:V-set and transmembrane domain-containing protein 2-like protein [Labeo rohita]|uniref:V-set and transmembrane domain-containing protein 2-like protein n=1 Tax=Labeo rohita TaxID=84645 RepID=A0ABQ8LIC5_LABRO|nr:V-set and transmembrane domain-containing protein 2-like protein [Labeo rohita]